MQHLKLTPWQIAALSKLCRDELKRLADLPGTPWANGAALSRRKRCPQRFRVPIGDDE
jgi:hypothetical protein